MKSAPICLGLACHLALGGCSNDLLPPGECMTAGGGGPPTVTAIPLLGQAVYFDDIRYAPALGKVLVPPEGGGGRLFLVDPASRAVTEVAVPGGTASADATASTIFVLDRSGPKIHALDATSHDDIASIAVSGGPDYLRVAPGGGEIWVTIPAGDRIDIYTFANNQLARAGMVAIPGAPEGLTFGTDGRAYTQSTGRVIPIDVARRVVLDEWDTGCGFAHGFPQVDDAYGLVVGGCASSGGASILSSTGGQRRAGFEAGADAAILAYNSAKHHLYLRGDNGATFDILAVCSDGGTSVLGSVDLSRSGHGATADDQGNAWVVDATTGGVFQIHDPYP